jgi:hypothetical protein
VLAQLTPGEYVDCDPAEVAAQQQAGRYAGGSTVWGSSTQAELPPSAQISRTPDPLPEESGVVPIPPQAPSAGAIGAAQQTAQQYQTPVPLPEESGSVPIPSTWNGQFTQSQVNPGPGLDRFANVRYNNPGAIQFFGQESASEYAPYGARTWGRLTPHTTALQFPSKVAGGAALFHLLNKNYIGMPLYSAVKKFTGATSGKAGTGNQADLNTYVANISHASGLKATDKIPPGFFAGPGGIAFAKAQAASEGPGGWGKPYPMSDDEWEQAHNWWL